LIAFSEQAAANASKLNLQGVYAKTLVNLTKLANAESKKPTKSLGICKLVLSATLDQSNEDLMKIGVEVQILLHLSGELQLSTNSLAK
jgi:hypothetical protein